MKALHIFSFKFFLIICSKFRKAFIVVYRNSNNTGILKHGFWFYEAYEACRVNLPWNCFAMLFRYLRKNTQRIKKNYLIYMFKPSLKNVKHPSKNRLVTPPKNQKKCYGIDASIRIVWEIQCLPYAEFFLFFRFSHGFWKQNNDSVVGSNLVLNTLKIILFNKCTSVQIYLNGRMTTA